MKSPHEPRDRNGMRIAVGDKVRIVGIPDLSSMSAASRSECLPAFQHLVGKYKRIVAFDEYGCAELNFAVRRGDARGWHTVWLEPFLLQMPMRGSNSSTRQTDRKLRSPPHAA